MSPDRFASEGYKTDTDIWSLGITLLESALGRFPYPEPDECGNVKPLSLWELVSYINDQPPPNPPQGTSEEFRDFLNLTLQKVPESRALVRDLFVHPFIKNNTDPFLFKSWLNTIPDVEINPI